MSFKVGQKIKGRYFDCDFSSFRADSHRVFADEVLEASAIDVFDDESDSLLAQNPEILLPLIK